MAANTTGGAEAPAGSGISGGAPIAGGGPEEKHPEKLTPKRVYPLFHPATASFLTGGRWFGAPRTDRLHAAVDLLNPYKSPIRAIADGVVLSVPYDFYLGTDALEVHHPGIGVVRYGEISPLALVDLKPGDRVSMGDVIAHVGQQDTTGFCMLHFELYTGAASGPLTEVWNPPYERRKDLINPSTLVDELHKLTFGD
jgi:murein DD-endopeptidase MepM/ murein hydrolase activator NlpD